MHTILMNLKQALFKKIEIFDLFRFLRKHFHQFCWFVFAINQK